MTKLVVDLSYRNDDENIIRSGKQCSQVRTKLQRREAKYEKQTVFNVR